MEDVGVGVLVVRWEETIVVGVYVRDLLVVVCWTRVMIALISIVGTVSIAGTWISIEK